MVKSGRPIYLHVEAICSIRHGYRSTNDTQKFFPPATARFEIEKYLLQLLLGACKRMKAEHTMPVLGACLFAADISFATLLLPILIIR